MKNKNLGLAVFINIIVILVIFTSVVICRAEILQIGTDTLACRLKDDTVRINKLWSKGENEAIGHEITNGNCLVLEKGTIVNIGKHNKDWVQVSLRGYNVPVWTLKKYLLQLPALPPKSANPAGKR